MSHTNEQLKQALAKMLPKRLYWGQVTNCLEWHDNARCAMPVLDTELLHLCWFVEETLLSNSSDGKWTWYIDELNKMPKHYYGISRHATWQQRCVALAKVTGIEI